MPTAIGSLIDISLRQQRGSRFFLLAPELGTVAVHWTQPGAICPWGSIAFPSPFRLRAEFSCVCWGPE
jgi:hypothetical protein